MGSEYYKYANMMRLKMLENTNIFSPNINKSKKSSLADFSFLAGNDIKNDDFSFLNLVNKDIASKANKNNSVNSAAINNMKSKLASALEKLTFKDNTIEINDNTKGTVSTLTHGLTSVIVSNMGVQSLLATLFSNTNQSFLYPNKNEFEDVTKTIKLMNSLVYGANAQDKINSLRELFPSVKEEGGNKELLARLKKLGIEPGKEIKIKGCKGSLFLEEDGSLYTMDEVNKFRENYNKTDYFNSKYGYNKNTVFKIDGQEYKLDETGHLNIPEGIICTPYRVKIMRNL